MKLEIPLFVIRVDNVVVDVESLQDIYSMVQPRIKKSWNLNKEALESLSKDKYVCDYENYFHLGEHEVKDVIGSYGNLKLSIEYSFIELN